MLRRTALQAALLFLPCFVITSLVYSQARKTPQGRPKADNEPNQVLTPRQVAGKAFASVVLLVMEDANGTPASLGSGFVIRDGIVATNLHVIEGAARGYAKPIGANVKHDIAGTAGIDEARDLVLLAVPTLKAASLPLADVNDIAVGDDVFAVGNPRGFEGTFSQGIVSGIRQIGKDYLLQITAPISSGSSGGPVLNKKGEVVGVAALTFKGGQNLNFAIPVSYLARLLSSAGTTTRLWAGTRSREQSLLREFQEGMSAGVTADTFAWDHDSCCNYSFTIRNRLRTTVKNISYMIVFYDSHGEPLHTVNGICKEAVEAALAKRVSEYGSGISNSVKEMTTLRRKDSFLFEKVPSTRLEIRILNFEIED